jgi:glycerate kinase
LLPEEIPMADRTLRQLARHTAKVLGTDFSKIPGAGAAGGLGFGLMTFAGGKPQSGFEIFSDHADLEAKIRHADVVLTGEGALDAQTLMGKGVGQIAALCKNARKPCIGLAGIVTEPRKAKRLFTDARGLVEITSLENATENPVQFLAQLTEIAATQWSRLQK